VLRLTKCLKRFEYSRSRISLACVLLGPCEFPKVDRVQDAVHLYFSKRPDPRTDKYA
jgi:hypothetical protein